LGSILDEYGPRGGGSDGIKELYYKDTPLTVTNFVGLAEGTLDAARKLLEMGGAKAEEFFGIIGLPSLNYEKMLSPTTVRTLINYDGE